jgi:hypothetical protein
MTSIASTHNNSSDNNHNDDDDDNGCSQSLGGGGSSNAETNHLLLNHDNNHATRITKKIQNKRSDVRRSRGGLFLVVWVLAGCVVGGMTFVLLRLKDKDNFETAVSHHTHVYTVEMA